MNILILGANSDVAQAVARMLAQAEKANFFLASRDLDLLKKKAHDLEIRFRIKAEAYYFDATDYSTHKQFYHQLNPKPDGVVLAFGYLGDQQIAQRNFQYAKKIIETNYLGAISILEIIAADFESRGNGFIIAISSVAGLRGRKSNYIYGSAKGALTVYLSGLRSRLIEQDVNVITILPGFIQTKMTENTQLPKLLTAKCEKVAADIYKALKSGKNIVYTKWYWRWIMLLIRLIPETVFKKLSI